MLQKRATAAFAKASASHVGIGTFDRLKINPILEIPLFDTGKRKIVWLQKTN